MLVRDLIGAGGRSFSFEFFPPKSEAAEERLFRVIRDELGPLSPTFVSVTYGAGGTTRDRTIRIVQRIAEETELTSVAHLTTVLTERAEMRALLDRLRDAGVQNILALRGDAPTHVAPDQPVHLDGLNHASDLVALIHEHRPDTFSVGVAGYPEVHPQAESAEADAAHLVAKVRAGADFVVTQFFFEARHYFDFVERARAAGLPEGVPVIPGIMPVTNLKQIARFAELSGAAFPAWLRERLEAVGDDPAAVRAVGVEVATELCRELLEGGAPGLHFYTLNKSSATREIYAALGLGPSA